MAKRVVQDEAFEAFRSAKGVDLGTRIKDVRDEALLPGGRARTTLFSKVAGGRPHPRLRFSVPPAEDPAPPKLALGWKAAPSNGEAFGETLHAALEEHAGALDLEDLDLADAPEGSERYWSNSIRAQRVTSFFDAVKKAVDGWEGDGEISEAVTRDCRYEIARAEAEAYAREIQFDDSDTGTYHSFGHDAPFVHYLESMLEALPAEGTEAMAVLPSGTRESVRRQREQATAHLDYLMRNKYTYETVKETDVERTIGGFLIDRVTRKIVSEVRDGDPIAPEYELLRIAENADHERAGTWLYRDAEGKLRDQNHESVDVDEELVRSADVDYEAITFQRAPKDANLRRGIRFDWDENGWVEEGGIDWVSWAGHCDVKAVLESLGVTLAGSPSVTEYRSDADDEREYNRDLLLEMVASVIELGSMYVNIDGTGWVQRGTHLFGGSRNDSRPDRLQFKGPGRGRGFRWPLSGRRDDFVVTGLSFDGDKADLGTVFFRHLPDLEAVEFEKNPRFLKTVEGDYNIIDVTRARIEARVTLHSFDPRSGFLESKRDKTVLDLSEGADAGDEGRFFLGTHVDDVAERLIFKVYWEPGEGRIVAEAEQWEKDGDEWAPQPRPERNMIMPMADELEVTLSREMKRDNPAQFKALLDVAMREGKNICADTDKEAEVWNGVCTRLEVNKLGENREARTEHWHVDVDARFGSAGLDYIVKRQRNGEPDQYCPASDDDSYRSWPDFLWFDSPDVGSKGVEDGMWITNEAMMERGVIEVVPDDSVPSGFYVYDEHIKNTFELIFCGLGGYTHTIVHANKRYGFQDEASWKTARDALGSLRGELKFS